MYNYKQPYNPQENCSNNESIQEPNQNSIIKNNSEILSLINEHKQKLSELRNKDNILENKKYIKDKNFENHCNKDISSFDKVGVDDSIRVAKDFLKYNKEKTSKLFKDIDNKFNINFNNKNNNSEEKPKLNFNYIINYQENNNKKMNYNYKTHNDFYTNLDKTQYILNYHNNDNPQKFVKSENIEQSMSYENLSNINTNEIFKNNNIYTTNNEIYFNGHQEKNILLNSNIKLLENKLEKTESKIKSLKSTIDSLNKENQALKEYIIKIENKKVESNNLIINDKIKNRISFPIEKTDINNKNNILNNIEKIMYSINHFIKKMNSLFPNLENKKNFEDLNYEQYNELQNNLNNIENIVNDLYIQNIKKTNYSLNDNSLSDIISTTEYTTKRKKKQKMHKIIKKLKSRSANRIKKKNKNENNYYNNHKYHENNRNFLYGDNTFLRKATGPY